VPLTPVICNLNLPASLRVATSPNAGSTCGGGTWLGAGAGSPAGGQQPYFLGQGSAKIPANGSCAIAIEVVAADNPGTCEFAPPPFSMLEVWSVIPASTTLNVAAPIPGAPGAPTIVSATPGDRQATVAFAPPSNPGTSVITGCTVTSRPGGGIDGDAGTTSLTRVINGLVNGTACTFTVAASSAAGAGAPSGLFAAVTPAAPPGAPTNVIASSEAARPS